MERHIVAPTKESNYIFDSKYEAAAEEMFDSIMKTVLELGSEETVYLDNYLDDVVLTITKSPRCEDITKYLDMYIDKMHAYARGTFVTVDFRRGGADGESIAHTDELCLYDLDSILKDIKCGEPRVLAKHLVGDHAQLSAMVDEDALKTTVIYEKGVVINYNEAIAVLKHPAMNWNNVRRLTEFIAGENTELFKKFVQRDDIIKANGFESSHDFVDYLKKSGNAYLSILIAAEREDGITVSIKFGIKPDSPSVVLSDKEQEAIVCAVENYGKDCGGYHLRFARKREAEKPAKKSNKSYEER